MERLVRQARHHHSRLLTDNGACYRSRQWHQLLASQAIPHQRTRPWRPCTNAKVERFNRTLLAEWTYGRAYRSEPGRLASLAASVWPSAHAALGGHPHS